MTIDHASSLAYRGRIAPTPTGHLHLGHASTFLKAYRRAIKNKGSVVLRIEDLDVQRCKQEYVEAIVDDLRWLGVYWDEGPIFQSDRNPFYLEAWALLKAKGLIYPCRRSRKDVNSSPYAPHPGDELEPIYPMAWRPDPVIAKSFQSPEGVNWRFRVPDGRVICFHDQRLGEQKLIAGEDFGDFMVWRRDNIPSYELAVVVDDHHMKITEIVRGEDLLKSTARQILLYEALGYEVPRFYHTLVLCDEHGQRLSKRAKSFRIKDFRELGNKPSDMDGLIKTSTQGPLVSI